MASNDLQMRLELALEAAHMAVWDSQIRDENVIHSEIIWSAKGAALLGFTERPLLQRFAEFLACVHPDDRQPVHNTMQQAIETRSGYALEYRVIWPDSSLHWLSAKAQVFCSANEVPTRTLGIIWDVTGRKRAELAIAEQKELAEVTLSSIGDGVITTDETGKTQYLNRVAEHLTGWSLDLVKGMPIEEVFKVVDEASGEVFENAVMKCLRLGQTIGLSARSQLVSRNGRLIAIEDSAAPIRAADGRVLGAVIVFHDVSHERKLRHELSWHASHDMLTGLINRREFETHVAAALASAKHESDTHALLYLDLDQFKIVNDTCGHSAGDMLLQQLSAMLQSSMRDSDVLARLGGDELGVLLLNCPASQAHAIADKLRQLIKDFRFVWDSRTFEIGASIGLVTIDEDTKSLSELLSAADQACYVAKEQGRNRVHLYKESDVIVARRHGEMLWVSRLNEAFAKGRFKLYTQPLVGLNGNSAVKHSEILIRMTDGDGDLILPGAFIPAAERFDLMQSIDRWVIESLCRHIEKRQQALQHAAQASQSLGSAMESYSVNLSGVSLNDDHLQDFIAEQFERYQIVPNQICFEITETAAIGNLGKVQIFMENLKKRGCKFSLDDFGSGLSSFAYLQALPVDFLKIDGLFIRDIVTNPINHAMVTAINEVGHVMGLKTVAEFVESEAILATVQKIGLDFAQGYAVGTVEPL